MSLRCVILVALLLAGCETAPLRISTSLPDQVSICGDTRSTELQDAEELAAEYCGRRGLLPQLAGTDRCSRHAVRYDYRCWAPGVR